MRNLFERIAVLFSLVVIGVSPLIGVSPALAQSVPMFLQFGDNGAPCAKWFGQTPANVTVYPWSPSVDANGKQDLDERNYQLLNGAVVYAPPVVPPRPNMSAFKDGIWASAVISPAVKLQLTVFFPVLESYLSDPVKIQTAWGAMVTTAPWLTPDVKTAVEAIAKTNNIPITP